MLHLLEFKRSDCIGQRTTGCFDERRRYEIHTYGMITCNNAAIDHLDTMTRESHATPRASL